MKVSVLIITYNHERYIAQAINSVLLQNVDFDYELVIGEDCSTDNTRNIVIDFRARYPDKIRLVLSDSNVGAYRNWTRTLKECQGEYFANLDGDDYWTSPDKLQKQVDFLDGHPECSICFHNASVFFEDGQRDPYNFCPANQKEISTLEDLLEADYIPSCARMVRGSLFDGFPDWSHQVANGDALLNILLARRGKVGYIAEVLGAYRIHQGGIWSNLSYMKKQQMRIIFYKRINELLDFAYETILNSKITRYWDDLAVTIIEQGIDQGAKQGTIVNIEDFLRKWPQHLAIPDAWKVHVFSEIYARLVFMTFHSGDLNKTRQWWWRLLRYDRSWLKNRGFWSIGVRSIGALIKKRLFKLG